jgi:hypothetical protein
VALFYQVALNWVKRSDTGKRGETLGRRGTLVREEHHWLKRGVTGKRR